MLFSNRFPQLRAAHEGNYHSYNWLATKPTMVTSLPPQARRAQSNKMNIKRNEANNQKKIYQCHFCFCQWNVSDERNKKSTTTLIKSHSLSSFWSSQSVRLEHSSRILHCGYFHSEQAWKEPEGSYPLPLMSETSSS